MVNDSQVNLFDEVGNRDDLRISTGKCTGIRTCKWKRTKTRDEISDSVSVSLGFPRFLIVSLALVSLTLVQRE